MKIIIIKGDSCTDHVRVKNFIKYFDDKKYDISFYCWLRNKDDEPKYTREQFILKGGGYSNNKLIFYYPMWILTLFLKLLFSAKIKKANIIFAIDFDSAFPVYILSFFKPNVRFIYDIHDDFSLRYNFPVLIKKGITKIDKKIKSRALKVIHVDENRIREDDDNYIVIYNSQSDFYENKTLENVKDINKTFAFTGLIGKTRGVISVYNFAKENPKCLIITAGKIIDEFGDKFIKLPNVHFLGYITQENLFEQIKNCHGIFSLYDTSKEINVLAASNKLYDAMMLGVPVIVNKGLHVEEFVVKNGIGFAVNFDYDKSWEQILDFDSYYQIRVNGRLLYEKNYSFNQNITLKLDTLFKYIINEK